MMLRARGGSCGGLGARGLLSERGVSASGAAAAVPCKRSVNASPPKPAPARNRKSRREKTGSMRPHGGRGGGIETWGGRDYVSFAYREEQGGGEWGRMKYEG